MKHISREDYILQEIELLKEDLSEWGFGGSTEEKEAKKKAKQGQEFLGAIVSDLGSRDNPNINTITTRSSKLAQMGKDEFIQQNVLKLFQDFGKKPDDISKYKITGDKGFIDFYDNTQIDLGWAEVPTNKDILGSMIAPWSVTGKDGVVQSGKVAVIYDVNAQQKKEAEKDNMLNKIKSFGFGSLEKIDIKNNTEKDAMNIQGDVARAIKNQTSQYVKSVWNLEVYRAGDKGKMKSACDVIDDVFESVAALYNKVYGAKLGAGAKLWDSLYDQSKEAKSKSMSQQEYEEAMSQALESTGVAGGGLSTDIVVNAKGVIGGYVVGTLILDQAKKSFWSQNVSSLGNPIVTFAHLFYYLAMTKTATLANVFVAVGENAKILVGNVGAVQESRRWGNSATLTERVDAMRRGVDLLITENVMTTKKENKKNEDRILDDLAALREDMRGVARGVMRESLMEDRKVGKGKKIKTINGVAIYLDSTRDKYACWKGGKCLEEFKKLEDAEDWCKELDEGTSRQMTLKECIISYIPESLREDYDPEEDAAFDNEFGGDPDHYAGMNYAPEMEVRDEEDADVDFRDQWGNKMDIPEEEDAEEDFGYCPSCGSDNVKTKFHYDVNADGGFEILHCFDCGEEGFEKIDTHPDQWIHNPLKESISPNAEEGYDDDADGGDDEFKLYQEFSNLASEPETYDGERWDWYSNGITDGRSAESLAQEWDEMQRVASRDLYDDDDDDRYDEFPLRRGGGGDRENFHSDM